MRPVWAASNQIALGRDECNFQYGKCKIGTLCLGGSACSQPTTAGPKPVCTNGSSGTAVPHRHVWGSQATGPHSHLFPRPLPLKATLEQAALLLLGSGSEVESPWLVLFWFPGGLSMNPWRSWWFWSERTLLCYTWGQTASCKNGLLRRMLPCPQRQALKVTC